MQTFFEDVAIGQGLPPVTKRPNLMQMVRWAGASENLHPVHYDPEVIKASGVPDALVHGRLKAAFVTEVVTNWMGTRGTLHKLSIRLLGMDFPNQELVCRGKVIGKPETSGGPVVECEIWLETPQGEVTVRGTAIVSLPHRNGS